MWCFQSWFQSSDGHGTLNLLMFFVQRIWRNHGQLHLKMWTWLLHSICIYIYIYICILKYAKSIHFFDDARCNSPTFNLRLLRRACLGFKQWCFPDGGFQAPQAMARRLTGMSTIYGIWMFPKKCFFFKIVLYFYGAIPWNMFPYIWFIAGNPMKIGVPLNHLFVHGISHYKPSWGKLKDVFKPMVFSHPNPGCLVQTAILGQRRMLETHGRCLQLPYQHMGLSKD